MAAYVIRLVALVIRNAALCFLCQPDLHEGVTPHQAGSSRVGGTAPPPVIQLGLDLGVAHGAIGHVTPGACGCKAV